MTSSVKKLSPVLTELTIEVSEEDVAKAMDKAFAQLGRGARIRGFRKGKAPRAVLRRMFGDTVRNEVRGDLVGTHLQKAVEEHSLEPISQPDVDAKDLKDGEAFNFTVKFEIRPTLDTITVEGIELEKHRVIVKAEDVDREIQRLRSTMAEVIDLEEPRPAALGDQIKINIKQWTDGEWKESGWSEQEVVVGENKIEEEIEEILVGMNIGDEKVVDLGSSTDLEGDRVRYLVSLTSVQGRKLPDLDDEFAKDMGDYDTLEALRESVDSRLKEEGEKAGEQRLRHALFDALREKNSMELPASLVERQSMALTMRVQSSLSMLGQGGPDEKEREKMLDRVGSAAKDMVHQHLLLLECARHENIEVKDEEIEEALEDMARESGLPVPMVKAEYGKEGRREELGVQLIEKKVFDFLLPMVKITEIDPPTEPKEGKEE